MPAILIIAYLVVGLSAAYAAGHFTAKLAERVASVQSTSSPTKGREK